MGSYFAYYLTGFIMIPVFIFATYCQIKVKTSFSKYSKVRNRRGMTVSQTLKLRKLQAHLPITMTLRIKKFAFRRTFLIQQALPLSVLLAMRRGMLVNMLKVILRLN